MIPLCVYTRVLIYIWINKCVNMYVYMCTYIYTTIKTNECIYTCIVIYQQRTNVKEREREIERECVKVRERTRI